MAPTRGPAGESPGLVRLDYLEDGTPYAPAYGDVYRSRSGPGQAAEVFMGGCRVAERCAGGGAFAVLETGLGLGSNLVATLRALAARPPAAPLSLRYAAIELHPVHPDDLAHVHRDGGGPARAFLAAYGALLAEGRAAVELGPLGLEGEARLELALGDGAAALAALEGPFDALYLDGFAPDRNGGLWNAGVYAELARVAAPGALLASYTAASQVRRGLEAVGFEVERLAGFGGKRHRIVGRAPAEGPPAEPSQARPTAT